MIPRRKSRPLFICIGIYPCVRRTWLGDVLQRPPGGEGVRPYRAWRVAWGRVIEGTSARVLPRFLFPMTSNVCILALLKAGVLIPMGYNTEAYVFLI